MGEPPAANTAPDPVHGDLPQVDCNTAPDSEHGDLAQVDCNTNDSDRDDLAHGHRHVDDLVAVARLLGREPGGHFEVVVRDSSGGPAVIRNAPILGDGRPMPTRYWFVDETLRRLVGRLESQGGVRAAEAAVDPAELSEAHDRYAAERDAAVPEGHRGPRPSGGVGGTRRGVKCLHAHYAWHLAGGGDPVGRWVAERLGPDAAVPLRRVQ